MKVVVLVKMRLKESVLDRPTFDTFSIQNGVKQDALLLFSILL
jgi:hypothetical protein